MDIKPFIPRDLSLSSYDEAIDALEPEMRPTLIIGPALAEIAEKLRGERDFTVKIVPQEEIGSFSWWVVTSADQRYFVEVVP